MNNHSLFQIILLAVFGSLAVAGVLIFAFAVGGNQKGTSIGKVVIWGTLDKTAVNNVLDKAGAANSDLQQVTYVQKDPSTYEQDISDALAQGTAPDMFILSSDYAAKDEPKIYSLAYAQTSAVTFQNIFVEAANAYLGPNGIEGFPFLMDPLVLYWNRDLLSGAGYSEPPKYWEDIEDMTEKITVRDGSGAITTATIALGTYQNIENAKATLSAILLQKGVSITAYSTGGKLVPALSAQSTGSAKQPAADALAFYTSFADPSQNFYTWNGAMHSARSAFAAGDVALYIGYASEASLIVAMNPNLNFAMSDMPQFKGAPRPVDFARVYAFAVPRVAANINGALLAAQLLDSATTSGAFSSALGIPSVRRDTLALPAQGYGILFNRMAIISRTWADPDPVQTNDLFRGMIENTISGASTITQSIERGDQQMRQIISQ